MFHAMLKRFSYLLLLLALLVNKVDCVCKTTLTEIEQRILNKHNNLRRLHADTADLCYGESDSEHTFQSQSWSETLAERGRSGMSHSNNPDTGENIMWMYGRSQDPAYDYERSIQVWYNEIEFWNYNTAQIKVGARDAGEQVFHFTQVIWKGSLEVNCGDASQSSGNGLFITCQYYPAGNFLNAMSEFVGPLIDGDGNSGGSSGGGSSGGDGSSSGGGSSGGENTGRKTAEGESGENKSSVGIGHGMVVLLICTVVMVSVLYKNKRRIAKLFGGSSQKGLGPKKKQKKTKYRKLAERPPSKTGFPLIAD